MSNYLISHFKGQYRVLAPIDAVTGDFVKEHDGSYSTSDLYIKCMNNIKIFHYGNDILEAYIPSIGRGHNILKAIQETYPDVVLSVQETDEEVLFKFKSSNMTVLSQFLKPSTNGSGISPYSSKNRPKQNYIIPDEDLNAYASVIAPVPPEKRLSIGHMTSDYLKTAFKSKKSYEAMKAELKVSGLKQKEFIHSKGLWSNYLKYLTNEIKKL